MNNKKRFFTLLLLPLLSPLLSSCGSTLAMAKIIGIRFSVDDDRVAFDHMDCEGASVAFGFFYDLPGQPIGSSSITIANSCFSMKKDTEEGCPTMMCDVEGAKKKGFLFTTVKNVRLENVLAAGNEGEEKTLVMVESFKKT